MSKALLQAMLDNIANTRKKLAQQKIDTLLISSSYNIGYLTGFFGFSKIEREGYVLITKNHVYFFASGLNSEAVAGHIDTFTNTTLVEISPRTPLTKKALAQIVKKEKIKKLGFEKQNLTFAEYEKLKKDLRIVLVPTGHFIEELRMIKSIDEIRAIEKACKLGDKTFAYILTKIKPGVTEKELAFEIELFIRKTGAEISFLPIVAFGPNSSIPHHVTSNQRLRTNSWVLLDFGAKIDNYCSDMTRTVFLGKANSDQKRMYQTVLESQKQALNILISQSPNISAKKVDKAARNHIASKDYPTIPHSVGHGIGLEVHEPPSLSPKSKAMLKPSMVFSIEPGIYLPNIGGVRIEDLITFNSSGPKFLTNAKREFLEL